MQHTRSGQGRPARSSPALWFSPGTATLNAWPLAVPAGTVTMYRRSLASISMESPSLAQSGAVTLNSSIFG